MKRYYNSKVAYYIHGQYDLLMEEGNWRNQINQLNLNGGCNAARHQQNQQITSISSSEWADWWFVVCCGGCGPLRIENGMNNEAEVGEPSHSIQFLPIKFKLKIWFDEEMNVNERGRPGLLSSLSSTFIHQPIQSKLKKFSFVGGWMKWS